MNLSDNMKGAVFMMVSVAAFVINDSLMKSLSGDIPLFQAIFLRGVFATLLVSILAARAGVIRWSVLAPVDRPTAMIRVCAEIGVTSCFLQALFNMPLANATAILQGAPFALTFAAAVFLREKVGWRRWTAIGVGFIGVIFILKPSGGVFDPAAILPLASALMFALYGLLTRYAARRDSTATSFGTQAENVPSSDSATARRTVKVNSRANPMICIFSQKWGL